MDANAHQPAAVVVAVTDPPRFRWLRRMIVVTVVWAAAVFAAWKGWHSAADSRLRAEVAAIAARGEPVELAQVGPAMPFERDGAGGEVALAVRMVMVGRPPAPQTWGIDHVNRCLSVARSAATRPVTPLPSQLTTGQSELAALLRAAALREHARGNDAESLALIDAMLQQADVAFVSCASLTLHRSGGATRAGAAAALMQMAPKLNVGPTPNDGGAAAKNEVHGIVRRLLDESRAAASFTRGWYAERVQRIDASQSPVYARAPPLTVYRHDMVRAIRRTTRLLEAARGGTFPRAEVDDLVAGRPLRPALDRWARSASDFYLDEGWAATMRGHFHMLADARAAAVHLAIRLYALDHAGAPPPPTLAALVPAYLPAVPRDPFGDGTRPISYRVAGRHALVYSVGEDGDDGVGRRADITLIRPTRRGAVRQLAEGDDVVYPITLPAAE